VENSIRFKKTNTCGNVVGVTLSGRWEIIVMVKIKVSLRIGLGLAQGEG